MDSNTQNTINIGLSALIKYIFQRKINDIEC